MRQLGGRAKALKGASLDARFEQVNPTNGDLWVYSNVDQLWHNTKILPEALTLQAALTGTSLSLSGAISALSMTLTGDLAVAGTSNLGVLNATTINATTLAFGSATISGALTVGGALTGSSFSFSGAGTISGALTVGGALAVTGAISGASLTVTGAITGASEIITGNVVVGGNETILGNLSVTGGIAGGNGLSIDGNAAVTGQLVLGAGGTYTQNSIAFLSATGATITTSGGTLALPTVVLLSLATLGLRESTGDPNGRLAAGQGSMALRNDSTDMGSMLYLKTGGGTSAYGWTPFRDWTSEIELMFLRYQLLTEALQNVLNADGSVGIVLEDI